METSENGSVAEKPMEVKMLGYEVVEKVAKPCATSARILVPKEWIGKRVRAVRPDHNVWL
jgi:putative transposon-encoded protein